MGHYDSCREGYCHCGQGLDSKGKCYSGCKTPLELRDQTITDLAMLVMRLCRKLPKESRIAKDALDYLVRKNLTGSPLRNKRKPK